MSLRVSRREMARKLLAPARAPSARARATAPLPLPAISFERHLLSRATFGRNAGVTADIQAMGPDEWLAWQLEPDAIDDSAVEEAVQNVLTPYNGAAPDVRMLLRAIWSRRQLAWRMTYFLNNHFSTNRLSTQAISETNEDDAFYKVCFTNFATVLRTSAQSPAMIDYLDNRSNVRGNPNENYAREVLELHTVGIRGGYNENDVVQAAKVFTGWSRVNTRSTGPTGPIDGSNFVFLANRHDTGPKSLSLGWSTPGFTGPRGREEGESLLDFLAVHPSTASFVTTKLCRYFAYDNPSPAMLQRVRRAYELSYGDLKTTLLAIFNDPEFAAPAAHREKVHDGFEFVASLVRRLEIPLANARTLSNEVAQLNSLPHAHPDPTGYEEIGEEWQGTGNVLPRWTFAYDLVYDRLSGVRVPYTALFGQNRPTNGGDWVATLLDRLVDGDVPATTVAALTYFMDQRLATLPTTPTLTQVLPHVRALISLVIRLPEAQLC